MGTTASPLELVGLLTEDDVEEVSAAIEEFRSSLDDDFDQVAYCA